jgi:hypothetical protein
MSKGTVVSDLFIVSLKTPLCRVPKGGKGSRRVSDGFLSVEEGNGVMGLRGRKR